MTIDPHNLGPRVFKEDQVITYQDLEDIVDELSKEANKDPMDTESFKRYITAMRVLKVLALWLEEGKPKQLNWEKS